MRMAFVYVPNGIDMRDWNPTYEGTLGELPRILQAAGAVQETTSLLLGNLTHNTGRALLDGAAITAAAAASYLPAFRSRRRVTDIKAGVSMRPDRREQIGKQTRFPSLEIGLEDARQAGDCDSGYSCAYTNNLAWRSETQPLPPILDPRALFERLFGDGVALSPEARVRGRRSTAAASSISSPRTRKKLQSDLGPTDRASSTNISPPSARSNSRSSKAEKDNAQIDPQHGQAVRRAGRFRRALQADDRHDDGRVPGRPDARADVPGDARRHVARLSRDRHLRRPPSADAPPQPGRADGEGGADQHATT